MASTSFLPAEQLSGYGRYGPELLEPEVLERFFFLDDADREVVANGVAITIVSVTRCNL